MTFRLFEGSNLLIGGSGLSMPVKAYKENDFTGYALCWSHLVKAKVAMGSGQKAS